HGRSTTGRRSWGWRPRGRGAPPRRRRRCRSDRSCATRAPRRCAPRRRVARARTARRGRPEGAARPTAWGSTPAVRPAPSTRAPAAGGAVAGLALHAVLHVDVAGNARGRNVGGVTVEAERLLIGLLLEAHVAHDARGALVEEDVVGAGMPVAVEPEVILVLQDA